LSDSGRRLEPVRVVDDRELNLQRVLGPIPTMTELPIDVIEGRPQVVNDVPDDHPPSGKRIGSLLGNRDDPAIAPGVEVKQDRNWIPVRLVQDFVRESGAMLPGPLNLRPSTVERHSA
jgi:hypothetical protein